jgi:5,10-methylene-tetrahydrofolate dehydrogenase/methenyl tetrahydrofolate cyclohydrolase
LTSPGTGSSKADWIKEGVVVIDVGWTLIIDPWDGTGYDH